MLRTFPCTAATIALLAMTGPALADAEGMIDNIPREPIEGALAWDRLVRDLFPDGTEAAWAATAFTNEGFDLTVPSLDRTPEVSAVLASVHNGCLTLFAATWNVTGDTITDMRGGYSFVC